RAIADEEAAALVGRHAQPVGLVVAADRLALAALAIVGVGRGDQLRDVGTVVVAHRRAFRALVVRPLVARVAGLLGRAVRFGARRAGLAGVAGSGGAGRSASATMRS